MLRRRIGMKNNRGKKAARVLASLFAGTLTISSSAYAVVNVQRSVIDANLGISSYKVVTDTDASDDNLYGITAKQGKFVNVDGVETDVDATTLEGLFTYEKDVAVKQAAESAVLLKNENNALPLNGEAKENVTLLGSRSYAVVGEVEMWGMTMPTITGTRFGGNMGSVAPADLCESITDALKTRGFTVNQTVADAYASYLENEENQVDIEFSQTYSPNESNPTDVGLDSLKDSFGNVAIVTVGRPASESKYYVAGEEGKANPDEYEEGTDVLGLSKDELATLQYARDNFEKVIVLINAVSMDVPELDQYADAIMWVGLPGAYGFEGIAAVLDGTVSPSGALTDTYAAKASNSIAMVNQEYSFQSGNGVTIDNETYTNEFYEPEAESIYTGYKYYESRYYDSVLDARNARDMVGATNGADTWNYNNEVVWSFGYGLSYTDFEESGLSVKKDDNAQTVTAEVTVKNTGDVAGKHIVELYAQVPYTEGGLEKSAIQLIGFDKTETLQPGEEQTVTISCDYEYFASWDRELEHNGVTGAYVLDAGDYYFATGNGANDALNNVLAAQGYTADSTDGYMTADGDAEKTASVNFGRVEITKSNSGEMYQNQLDNMDLALQMDEVENFSRSDWKNNWPKVYDNLVPTADMKDALENQVYTLNANGDPSTVKFGQDNGLTIADLKPEKGEKLSYDDPLLQMYVEQYDLGDAVAALINGDSYSMGATTVSGKEKAQSVVIPDDGPMGFDSYTAGKGAEMKTDSDPYNAANDPDYETYKDTPMRILPTGVNIGATWNTELNHEAGEMIANLALWNGASVIQAPGSNIHRNAYNARNHEYYSEDGMLSGIMMSAYCGGAWEYGLVTTVKHFAFNDTELHRMGVSAYMSEQRARENELRAFQVGIEDGNVNGMMMGMNRAGGYFVGANPGLMSIIRDEWAFNGIIVTDMTVGTYDNSRDSLVSGVDSMLQSITADKAVAARDELLKKWDGDNQYATGTVSDAVAQDTYFLTQIQTALKHITWVTVNSNYMNGIDKTTRMERVNTWYDNAIIAAIAVSAAAMLILFGVSIAMEAKGKKEDAGEAR